MKQTNNAIKFLMAQYRAIFKNAYFKGLTSAVLLTAGMAAAGGVQAAQNNVLEIEDFVSGGAVINQTISQDSKIDLGDLDAATQIATKNTYLGDTVIEADVTITGTDIDTLQHVQISGSSNALTIQNGGSLTAINSRTTGTSINGGDMTKGTLTIKDKGSVLNLEQFSMGFNKIELTDGATATLGGLMVHAKNTFNTGATNNADWAYYTNLSANSGSATSGDVSISNSTLNLNDQSMVTADNTLEITGNSVINFNGTSHLDKDADGDLVAGDKYATAFLRAGDSANTEALARTVRIASETVNGEVLSPTLNVADGAWGAIYSDNIKVLSADVNVGNNATFILDGNWTKGNTSGKELAQAGTHNSATISFRDVTFKNNGTVILGNSKSGGTITVAGTTDMQGKVNNYTGIKVVANEADDSTRTEGHLIISEDQLLKKYDSDNKKIAEGIWAGSDSAIILQSASGGTNTPILTLVGTDADGLDLNNDVDFVSQADLDKASGDSVANYETAFYSGKIYVRNRGIIDGEHLVLTKALDLADISKLTLDGDVLELGANDYRTGSLTGLGIAGAIAHDQFDAQASGNAFTIDGPLVLSRDYYTKDASGDYTTTLNDPGRITGDNLVIGNATTIGTMTISGGAFVNEGQALTITSGSLTVGAVEAADQNADDTVDTDDLLTGNDGKDNGWQYFKNGNPASLTWTGDFKINGTSGQEPDINVTGASGATATLDLTGANVTWGSGSITLEGATDTYGDPYQVSKTDYFAVGGEGVLTITGNQFADYLDIQTGDDTDTATELTISGGGVLLVEGAVTGAINFNKFTSGGASAGVVYFNNGGRLVSTGELSLVTGVDTNGDDTVEEQSLTLGDGAIIAQGITINNRNPDAVGTDADLADNVVTVSGGALAVASRLATSNNEIRFEGADLVLDSNGFTRYGLSATEGGAVSAAKLTFSGDGSTFEVVTGDWTVGANGKLGDVDVIESGNVVIGADAGEYIRNNIGASLQIDNLSLAGTPTGASNLEVKDGGELTVNTIQAANTSLSVTGGTLTINGRELVAADFESESEPESLVDLGEEDGIAQAGIDLTGATINVSNQGHFVLGDTAANALVKFTPTATDTVDVVEVNEALDSANITLSNGSEFRLDFASGTASTINGGSGLTTEQAAMLKDKLGTFEGGSYVNVGQLALNMKYDKETLTAQWSDIKDFVQVESDVVNNDIKQLLVQGITSSDEISGHFGAVEADVVGQNTIRVNGNLGLHKAYDGYFASVVNANGQRSEVGLTLTTYSTVQLEGAGTVGTLEGQGTGSDSDVVFAEGEYYPGAATVEGDIRAIGELTVNNDVNVTDNVTVGAAEINQALSAKNVTLEGGENGSSLVTGTLNATEVLTVGTATQQNTLTVANGSVITRDLVLANGSTLQVGLKAAESDDPETAFNEAANYTGSLEAQNVDLGNGGVMVDPVNELQTAFVSFNKFKDASKAQNSMDLGTINGSVYVGNNSVLGIGSSDLASLREYVAEHQHNGALVDYGSILAVNGQATLGAGHGIVMTAQMPDDFKAYMAENKWTLDGYNTVANSVYFGDGTAMKVTAEAINSIGAQNNKNALITISGNDGQLIADGGEILISGEVRANRQYTLFTDGNGAVDVVNVDKTTAEAGEGITVTTENGFLLGEINSTTGGVVTLGVNENSRAIMAGASDPVYTTLVAYARGYNGEAAEDGSVAESQRLYDGYTTETVTDPATGQQTTNRVKDYNYSNYFLNESVATGNGAAAESVARLSIYGGAAQAAISAGASTYDAVSGRMGVGANGANITVADNTQGAALWLAPIYKSSDSDDFDAESVDYGVDMDLYGVALGADYTLSNGIRFGAMFNVVCSTSALVRLMVKVLALPCLMTSTTTALPCTVATLWVPCQLWLMSATPSLTTTSRAILLSIRSVLP